MTYDIAIFAATVPGREALLERSQRTWGADAKASGRSTFIGVYHDDPPSGSNYRGYNHLVAAVDADVYLFTHPEVMFPPGTIAKAYEVGMQPMTWAGFKVYWLPQHMTDHLEDYDFPLEDYDDLYRLDPKDHGPFYWNVNVPGITEWNANTTYAMSRETTRLLFPMPTWDHWGPDDPYQAAMRERLGIRTVTVPSPIVYHQWHPASEHASMDDICAEATKMLP